MLYILVWPTTADDMNIKFLYCSKPTIYNELWVKQAFTHLSDINSDM